MTPIPVGYFGLVIADRDRGIAITI